MSTHQITQGSVVVGVDGSASSQLALRWAADEAGRMQRPLHVVHALETEVVLSDKLPLGTKEAAASSDAIVTEAVFAWPGLGSLALSAIRNFDYPLAQACILTMAGIIVAVNLGIDILVGALDPRIRFD